MYAAFQALQPTPSFIPLFGKPNITELYNVVTLDRQGSKAFSSRKIHTTSAVLL